MRRFSVLTLALLLALCLFGCAPEVPPPPSPSATAAAGVELPELTGSPAPIRTLAPTPGATPTIEPAAAPQTPLDRMTADIGQFCKTHRLAGTSGEVAALDAAAGLFASLGLQVKEQPVAQEGEHAFSTRNVIGVREAAAPNAPILILCAHADSVAAGPGATDDAAGLAVLLECARQAAAFEGRAVEVRFIAFCAEEWQARGSRDYVAALSTAEKGRILGVLTLDMFSSKNAPLVFGYYEDLDTTYGFWQRISAAAQSTGTLLPYDTPAVMMSDAMPFERAGIPAVLLTHSTVDGEYHTADDTPDQVDENRLTFALGLSLALIGELVNG